MFSKLKSQGTLVKSNIEHQLDLIQIELRHQRLDNATILRLLNILINSDRLQKQVTDYYTDEQETSPQTEQGEHQ